MTHPFLVPLSVVVQLCIFPNFYCHYLGTLISYHKLEEIFNYCQFATKYDMKANSQALFVTCILFYFSSKQANNLFYIDL